MVAGDFPRGAGRGRPRGGGGGEWGWGGVGLGVPFLSEVLSSYIILIG